MALLDDTPVHVRLRLSGLWASLTLCYLYGDYFGLFRPGALQSMLDGKMGPLGPTTQGVLLGASALLAVPCLMVALCLLLPARGVRIACIVFGVLYTLVMLVSMPGAWLFYQAYGVIEMALSLAIAWQAWRWPKRADA